jgi:hypothetical protein
MTFGRKEDNMAKVDLKIQTHLTAAQMRQLNPHLRRKGLTIQQAVDRGFKERIPAMFLTLAAFLSAIEGIGIKLDR